MNRTRGVRGARVAFLAVTVFVLGASCGEDEAGGTAGAAQVVAEFVDGWARVSGVERDTLSAADVRVLLAGDLRGMTDAARPVSTPTAGQAPHEGGTNGRRIEKVLNELVGLPLPPDLGLEVLDTVTTGAEARVTVRLQYSANAAGIAAAEGLLPFDALQEAHGAVIVQPTRTFVLNRLDGSWRIVGINQ